MLINKEKEMKVIKVEVENKEVIVDDGSKCVCGSDGLEEHSCPFSEEIHGDYDSVCNCCSYCTHQCAMDI